VRLSALLFQIHRLKGIFLSRQPDFTVQYQISRTRHPLNLVLHTNYPPRDPLVILFYPLHSPPLQLSLSLVTLPASPPHNRLPPLDLRWRRPPEAELQGRRRSSLPCAAAVPPSLLPCGGLWSCAAARPGRRRHPSSPLVPAGASSPPPALSSVRRPCRLWTRIKARHRAGGGAVADPRALGAGQHGVRALSRRRPRRGRIFSGLNESTACCGGLLVMAWRAMEVRRRNELGSAASSSPRPLPLRGAHGGGTGARRWNRIYGGTPLPSAPAPSPSLLPSVVARPGSSLCTDFRARSRCSSRVVGAANALECATFGVSGRGTGCLVWLTVPRCGAKIGKAHTGRIVALGLEHLVRTA
jgi:hypothetical protein